VEIDVVYLAALIQDCEDPIAVLQRSQLPGDRRNEQGARETLLKHFEKPLVYRHGTHSAHLAAMHCLGVDVPTDEEVSVVAHKRVDPTPTR
jgi:hypothetical protein